MATLSLVACGKIGGGLKLGHGSDPETLKVDTTSLEITEGALNQILLSLPKPRQQDTVIGIFFSDVKGNEQNTDFSMIPTSLTIPAGSLSKRIDLSSIDDSLFEGDESFILTFSRNNQKEDPENAIVRVILRDDDLAPQLAINDQTSLGESGSLTFTVTLSGNTALPVSVNYATSDGTAFSSADYMTSSGTLSFPVGTTTQTLVVPISTDLLYEANETFSLTLTSPINATIFDSTGIGTITNDDMAPTVQFLAASQSVNENTGVATVTVQLSAISGTSTIVPFTLTGTASGGGGVNDYTSPESPLTIAAGQTTANLTLSIYDDSLGENDETVILTIGTPTYATAGGITVHTLTIIDNDLGPFNVTGITSASDSVKDANLNLALRPIVNWGRSTNAASYDLTIYEDNGTTIKCNTVNVADPGTGTEVTRDFSDCSGGDLTTGQYYKVKASAKSAGSGTRDASNSLYRFFVNRAPVIGSNPTGNGAWFVLSGSSIVVDAQHGVSPATGVATDADGDTLTFLSVGTPTGGVGSVTNNSTSVTYSPGTYTGVDTFTFTMSDGRGGSVSGTMTVHVVTAFTWTGAAGDRDWATNGNWCGGVNANKTGCTNVGVEPTSSTTSTHTAIFDSTCQAPGLGCSPNLNANLNYTMYGFKIGAGYNGTITQVPAKTITVGSGGFTQASGSFVGSDANITFNGRMTVSAGNFTSTTATLSLGGGAPSADNVVGDINAAIATFNHNGGTVRVDIKGSCWKYGLLDIHGALIVNNFIYNGLPQGASCGSPAWFKLQSTDHLTVLGNFDHLSGLFAQGNIHLKSNLSVGSAATANMYGIFTYGTIFLDGTANQTYKGASTGSTSYVVVNKSSGTVTEDPASTGFNAIAFKLQSGSFTAPVATFKLGDSTYAMNNTLFEVASMTTFVHPASGTLQLSVRGNCWKTGNVNLNGALTVSNLTINSLNQGSSCGSPGQVKFTAGDVLTVSGNYTHTDGQIDTAQIQVKGNVTFGAGADGGSASVILSGTTAQSITSNIGAKVSGGNLTINNSLASVSLTSALSLNNGTSQGLVLQNSSTLLMGGFSLSINGALNLPSGSTVTKGGGILTYGSLTPAVGGGTIN